MPTYKVTLWKGDKGSRGGPNYEEKFTGISASRPLIALRAAEYDWNNIFEGQRSFIDSQRPNHAIVEETSKVKYYEYDQTIRKGGMGPGPWTVVTKVPKTVTDHRQKQARRGRPST